MTLAILFISTFAVFLAVDFVGLSYLIKPVFAREIGPLMTDSPRLLPAFLFYAFMVAVVIWFVSWPALAQDRSLFWVFGNAALIGMVGYGTYEFTSYAVMKDWTATMVALDFTWGTCLTGFSALAGVWVTRAIG